ncbi:MAG: aspartate--tRNA(Asn) ligase, partial [Candidatus Aenigmatarchaeota archaeon]
MKKNYTSELKNLIGKEVVLAGWCHDVRLLGNINFLLLRDKDGIVQVTAKKGEVKAEIIELMKELHQEDALLVRGKVVESKIAKKGIEVIPTEIKILSKSKIPLPLDPREVTKANLDTRLNHRLLDLRTQTSRAIFKIQARILQAFREFLTSKGFLEIQPPIIISSASEGGAELFSLPYFEKRAFLAQSPQLYKQICALAFEKVFMVVPVFRAEKFDQPTHLNELRQMDIEQAFTSDEEVVNALEEGMAYIGKEGREKFEAER